MTSEGKTQVRPSIAGPNTIKWRELDRKYLPPAYSADAMQRWEFIVAEAHGSTLRDVDGNTYIDFISGMGVCNVGNLHPKVVEAVQEQLTKLGHICGHLGRHESLIKLAQRLSEITPGPSLKKSVFRQSGAEAVETALGLARAYKKRPVMLSFLGDFHGLTLGAMSVSFTPWKTGWHGYMPPAVYPLPYAHCYRCYLGLKYPECKLECVEYVNRFIETISAAPATEIAGMIIEPIQSERGVIVPPDEYLPALKKICEKNDMLLVCDEIQTGFGRTGRMFAVDHCGIVPDLMILGKALGGGLLPFSAVVGKEILDTPAPCCGTFTGNPLSCSAALATIDILEHEKLPERALRLGEHSLERLKEMKNRYKLVGDVRGKGLLLGIEIVEDSDKRSIGKAREVFFEMQRRGVAAMCHPLHNVIRIEPPLNIEEELLDRGLDIVDDSLKIVAKSS